MLGGRYRVLEQIGGGGSAVVWRGYDQVLNRLVAIKVLSGPSATGRQAHDRIHAEARMAAALSHPHIAQIHDVGDDALDTPYVVMELVDGPTVDQVGPLTVPQVLRLGAEVASALAAAHAIGLVHRDIKPANIIITAGGAKVVDFGIAAPARVGGPAEPGSQLLGTPAYVAPERLTRDGVEPASDVYSLGVLLYRLLAGHLPWTAESTEQMLTDQVYVEPAPLPARSGLAPAVVDLCTACLAKNPADRPPAALVAHVLAAAAQSAIPTPEAPVKRSRKRLLLAATAAVAAVAALVAWQVAPTGPATVAEGEATPPSAQTPGPGAPRPDPTRAPPVRPRRPAAARSHRTPRARRRPHRSRSSYPDCQGRRHRSSPRRASRFPSRSRHHRPRRRNRRRSPPRPGPSPPPAPRPTSPNSGPGSRSGRTPSARSDPARRTPPPPTSCAGRTPSA